MITKQVFKSYSDPGHGWLAVKRTILKNMGILNLITPFSYQRGKTVYLEEDQDLTLFVDTYRRITGHDPTFKEGKWQERSSIRSYDFFRIESTL